MPSSRDSIATKRRESAAWAASKLSGLPPSAQRTRHSARRQSEMGINLFRQASATAETDRSPAGSALDIEYEEAEKLGFTMRKRVRVLCEMEGSRETGRNGSFAICPGRIRSISDDGRSVSIGVLFDDGSEVLYSVEQLLRYTNTIGGMLCECVLDWNPRRTDGEGLSLRRGEAIVLVADEYDSDGAKWWGFNGQLEQGWFPMECVRQCGFSLGERVAFQMLDELAPRYGECVMKPSGQVELRFRGVTRPMPCTVKEARQMAYRALHPDRR